MRNSIDLPRDIKRGFCRKCWLILIPGLTATIRLRSEGGNVIRVATCHLCWSIYRLEVLKR
ncbi:MAG: hypothetical protein ACP5GI_08460 [Sulfolobales archaeon]